MINGRAADMPISRAHEIELSGLATASDAGLFITS